jgi:thiamine-phosphate pyrophosphorylase
MRSIRGLYVIADRALLPPGMLVGPVEQALGGGATAVQYRDKHGRGAAHVAELIELRALCRNAGALLIINDDPALALELGADGVHLGRDDAAIADARAQLGAAMLIGASCYNDLSLALAARDAGATYVAFGSFFASPTKPDAVAAPIELLRRARKALALPVVAIGGITPDNGAELLAAGADALAVISGIFAQSDPAAAARRYARLWDSRGQTPAGSDPIIKTGEAR